MARRIHVSNVSIGELTLDEREAHHVRDVLRLEARTPVEAFDDAGHIGVGVLGTVTAGAVTIRVESIRADDADGFRLIIASAVPKAARADWMVEKLSELGVHTFIPIATDRSVSLPEGKGKLQRWQRLAEEAAKQSHRRGVMRIEPLTPLPPALAAALLAGEAWCFSTSPGSIPLSEKARDPAAPVLTLFIGPEGGWSPAETVLFATSKIPSLSLTRTILRIETAAIAAAAVMVGKWLVGK